MFNPGQVKEGFSLAVPDQPPTIPKRPARGPSARDSNFRTLATSSNSFEGNSTYPAKLLVHGNSASHISLNRPPPVPQRHMSLKSLGFRPSTQPPANFTDLPRALNDPTEVSLPHRPPSTKFNVPVDNIIDAAMYERVVIQCVTKRDNIAAEILHSEQSYLKSLLVLVDVYKRPLEDNSSNIGLSKDEVSVIFSNITDIIGVNKVLLSTLYPRIKSWDPETTKIGDCLLELTPFLKMYKQYTSTYDKALQVLDDNDSKESVIEFMKKGLENPACRGLDLRAMLIMPIQRIPRYRLLLQDLLDSTPPSHVDYVDLKEALERVKSVADEVDTSIKESQNQQKLFKIQKLILGDFEAMKPGRIYIKEGPLTKICRKDRKRRYFFLFNDILAYAYEYPNKRYRVGREFELTTVSLIDLPDDDQRKRFNAFQISSEAKSFIVFGATVEEKKSWLDSLTQALYDLKQKSKQSNSTPIVLETKLKRISSLAPVWIPDVEARMCSLCQIKFNIAIRRHHCRQCGHVVCSSCSHNRKQLRGQKKQRVCNNCAEKPEEDEDVGKDRHANVGGAGSVDSQLRSSLAESSDSEALSDDDDFIFIGQEIARYSYEPPASGSLNPAARKLGFKSGQLVNVIQKDKSGWWLVKIDQDVGWVPASYFGPGTPQMENTNFFESTGFQNCTNGYSRDSE